MKTGYLQHLKKCISTKVKNLNYISNMKSFSKNLLYSTLISIPVIFGGSVYAQETDMSKNCVVSEFAWDERDQWYSPDTLEEHMSKGVWNYILKEDLSDMCSPSISTHISEYAELIDNSNTLEDFIKGLELHIRKMNSSLNNGCSHPLDVTKVQAYISNFPEEILERAKKFRCEH